MRILLDHCVPSELRAALPDHDVALTAELGWEELSNGQLLREAAARFDAVLTIDKKMRFQQKPRTLPTTVLILLVRSNRVGDVLPCVSAIERHLKQLPSRQFVEVSPDSGPHDPA